MNVFHKIALQSLKQNKSRTLVTIIGVILSSALITAIATFAVSLQNYVVNGAVRRYGDWQIGFTDVPASFVQEQLEDKRVDRVVSFENIGYAILEGGINEYKPYLFIAGLDEECLDTLPVNLLSGRMPANSGEVIIPAHVASNGGVKFSLGDTVVLTVGQRCSKEDMQYSNTDAGNAVGTAGGWSGQNPDTQAREILNQHDPYRTEDAGGEELVPMTEKTYTVVGIYRRPS
ncbi:MAG: ABC transporter permease, partial [Acetatifactor sp.]|nr:ABC transporter permease [Acetatifactor sp.]